LAEVRISGDDIIITTEPKPGPKPGPRQETWKGEGTVGLLIKADMEQRYTLTVAYPANKPDAKIALDGHRDFAGTQAIENAAWAYMTKSRAIGLWHQDGTDGAGEVVESYIYRGPDWTVKAPGGSEEVIKAGDWMLGIRWSPEAWGLIKSGEINGVSMQGKGTRRMPTAEALAALR